MDDESVWTPADALRLVTAHAADVLALEAGRSDGLSAPRRIAAVAEAAGMACYGGTTTETSLGTAACAHLFCFAARESPVLRPRAGPGRRASGTPAPGGRVVTEAAVNSVRRTRR